MLNPQRQALAFEALESRQLLTTATGFSLNQESYYSRFIDGADPVGDSIWLRSGADIYVSDGTAEGTTRIDRPNDGAWFYEDDITPVVLQGPFDPVNQSYRLAITDVATLGDNVFFTAGGEVWQATDTLGEAVRLTDQPLVRSPWRELPLYLVEFKGTLFIYSKDEARLWKLKGNQVELAHEFRAAGRFNSLDVVEHLGKLWIFAQGPTGSQLWTMGDATSGPSLVYDWNDTIAKTSDVSLGQGQIAFTVADGRLEEDDVEFFSKQLWVSDGTAAGTRRIETQTEGMILATALAGDSLFYVQQNPEGNFDLWQYDLQAAKNRIAHGFSRIFRQTDSLALADNGILFVDGEDLALGQQTLYRLSMDGETKESLKGFARGIATALYSAGGNVFLAGDDGTNLEVWRSDGTIDGTVSLFNFPEAKPFSSLRESVRAIVDGNLIFTANNLIWSLSPGAKPNAIGQIGFDDAVIVDEAELEDTVVNFVPSSAWLTDGTRAGTRFLGKADLGSPPLLPDDPGGPGSVSPFGSPSPVTIGDTTFYVRSTPELGAELWAVTKGQSRLVKDILPGPFGSAPQSFYVIDDILYFTARDRTTLYQFGDIVEEHEENWEVFRSDGTEEGTFKLVETNPDPEAFPFSTSDSNAGQFRTVDRGFMFKARFKGERGFFAGVVEGWFSSDGTTEGTYRIEILDGATLLFSLPDILVFGVGGGVLISDGTFEGTVGLRSFEALDVTNVISLGAVENVGYFAIDSEDGVSIWQSDATAAGTRMIREFPDGLYAKSELTTDNNVYFSVESETSKSVWHTSGESLEFVGEFDLDQAPRLRQISPRNVYQVKETGEGYRPQDTDAYLSYREGTEFVEAIHRPSSGLQIVERVPYSINTAAEYDGRFYFVASPFDRDSPFGSELWSTDGTQAGTFLYDFTPGPESTLITDLRSTDDGIYITAEIRSGTRETLIWRIGDPLVGDLDNDGQVGFSDFLILATNFGQKEKSLAEGDLTGDGEVAFADFLALANNFGNKSFPANRTFEPVQQNFAGVEAVFAQRDYFVRTGGFRLGLDFSS